MYEKVIYITLDLNSKGANYVKDGSISSVFDVARWPQTGGKANKAHVVHFPVCARPEPRCLATLKSHEALC
jgi:hypothetical protein